MFGDMMGNMEAKQAEMQEKLAAVTLEAEAGGGAVKVTANATREITNIAIDKSKVDLTDTEELEDLLLVAVNRVIELAAEKEAEASQQMINDMLPGGLGGLAGMFGQ